MYVGRHSVVSSNVSVGGKTRIGQQTYIGLGAAIRDTLVIGDDTIVSMGAVVHQDVGDGVIVVGNPARVVCKNDSGTVFR